MSRPKATDNPNEETYRTVANAMAENTRPRAEEVVDTYSDARKANGYLDPSMLSDDEKEALGIKPNEEYAWVRDPAVWQSVEMIDHVRRFKLTVPGARVVTTQGGTPVRFNGGGDLVLVAYPKEVAEKRAQEIQKEQLEYLSRNPETARQLGLTPEQIREAWARHPESQVFLTQHTLSSQEEIRELEKYNREAMFAELRDSPTRGLPYEVAVEMQARRIAHEKNLPVNHPEVMEALEAEVRSIEESARMGSRRPPGDQWQEAFRRANGSPGGKSYFFFPGLKPKNISTRREGEEPEETPPQYNQAMQETAKLNQQQTKQTTRRR